MEFSRFPAGILAASALLGCTEEQQNKLSRVGVTWLEGGLPGYLCRRGAHQEPGGSRWQGDLGAFQGLLLFPGAPRR